MESHAQARQGFCMCFILPHWSQASILSKMDLCLRYLKLTGFRGFGILIKSRLEYWQNFLVVYLYLKNVFDSVDYVNMEASLLMQDPCRFFSTSTANVWLCGEIPRRPH